MSLVKTYTFTYIEGDYMLNLSTNGICGGLSAFFATSNEVWLTFRVAIAYDVAGNWLTVTFISKGVECILD